jgi:hypothetical protein
MIEIDDEECAKRIKSAFALLTAKLEDAADFAANGQSRRINAELQSLASSVADLGEEVATIAAVLDALLIRAD